jgi:serine protease Do
MRRVIMSAALTLLAGLPSAGHQFEGGRGKAEGGALPPTDSPVPLPPSPVVSAVLQAEAQRIAVMDKAKDSVLAIFGPTGSGGGSGVVISPDGYALTNFHVASPSGNAMLCGMADGRTYDAVIVGVDPTGDIALIQLFGRDDFPHAQLGDSDQVEVGDWCFAMGNPFLLATNLQPTVTYGIVSGVHRYQYPAGTLLEYADCIQTDASINPGNSGGPLFDASGRLIGINGRGSFEKRGRVNVGVAYAVSVNQIKNFLGSLRGGCIVDHATLGALAGFDADGRVVVTDILEQSDAYRRGLRYDDEIVGFGGRTISTPNGLKNVLGIFPKGWRVPLSFRREGKRYEVLVRLRGVHATEELLEKAEGRPRNVPMPLPKPGEEPKPGEPGPGEEPSPDQPKPLPRKVPGRRPDGRRPMPLTPRRVPMPEVVKQHFEAKRGYANYYYNRQNRDRVWKAWNARGDLKGLDGTWTLAGRLGDGGGQFSFQLADTDGLLKVPTGEWKWVASDDFGSSLAPPLSGGLLPALSLWRRLAVVGPEDFGDLSYLGTRPLPGHEGLLDVLVGLYKGVKCHFSFDPAEGHLLALEMFPEEDADPCEVYFSGYHEVDGRFLPAQMEVRVGDDPYGVFLLSQFNFEKANQP